MSEKKQIERSTAEAFLSLYNQEKGASFRIVEFGDAPDAHCADNLGARLNLEITLTEDRPGDIPALLGRSSALDADTLKSELESGRGEGSSLGGDVLAVLVDRIHSKLKKRYGPDTALVIRDASGVDWDWNLVVTKLRERLEGTANPFVRGVWLVNRSKDRLFRLL